MIIFIKTPKGFVSLAVSGRHTIGRRSEDVESEVIELEQRARPSWGTGMVF